MYDHACDCHVTPTGQWEGYGGGKPHDAVCPRHSAALKSLPVRVCVNPLSPIDVYRRHLDPMHL